MKEPKKFKLSTNAPSSKEPNKIPLKPLYIEGEEDVEMYDIYSLSNDDVYISKDLEKFKK